MAKNYGPNRVRLFREEAGISQDELAARLNTYKATISKLELGKVKLTIEWARRIAQALGRQIQWWELPADGETLQPDERQLLVGYRKLNDGAKRMILSMIEAGQDLPELEDVDHALPLAAEETPDRERPARRMGAKRSKYRAA